MNKIMIVVESAEGRAPRELWDLMKNDDICHVLSNLLIIKTEKNKEEIEEDIKKSGWLTKHDRYFVAMISQGWLSQNCKSDTECFD